MRKFLIVSTSVLPLLLTACGGGQPQAAPSASPSAAPSASASPSLTASPDTAGTATNTGDSASTGGKSPDSSSDGKSGGKSGGATGEATDESADAGMDEEGSPARCVIRTPQGRYSGACLFHGFGGGSFEVKRRGGVPFVGNAVSFIAELDTRTAAGLSMRTTSGDLESVGPARRSARDSACWEVRGYSVCAYGR